MGHDYRELGRDDGTLSTVETATLAALHDYDSDETTVQHKDNDDYSIGMGSIVDQGA